jgi:hypothetical protein
VNQLIAWKGTGFKYKANGNLTDDGPNTYTWDARNQLALISGSTSANFTYDPFGRRASRTISGAATSFLYDGINPLRSYPEGILLRTCYPGWEPTSI